MSTRGLTEHLPTWAQFEHLGFHIIHQTVIPGICLIVFTLMTRSIIIHTIYETNHNRSNSEYLVRNQVQAALRLRSYRTQKAKQTCEKILALQDPETQSLQ